MISPSGPIRYLDDSDVLTVFQDTSHAFGDLLFDTFSSIASIFSKTTARITSHKPTFSLMTDVQIAHLEELVEDKEGLDIDAHCREILSGDLKRAVFAQKDWLIFMFIGHQNGIVSASQLAAASHLDLYLRHYPDQIPSILSDVTPEVLSLVPGNLEGISFETLSPLEKIVLPVTIPTEKQGKGFDFYKLKSTQCPLLDVEKSKYLILSPAALQIIFHQLSPEYAVTLVPTIGYSTQMHHFLGHPHKRIIAIDCHYFPMPKTLHKGQKSSPFSYTFHDGAFHAHKTSFDPYREFEDSLASFLYRKDRKALLKAAITFTDRAFSYLPLIPSPPSNSLYSCTSSQEERFWLHVVVAVRKSDDSWKLANTIAQWYRLQHDKTCPKLTNLNLLKHKLLTACRQNPTMHRVTDTALAAVTLYAQM